VIWDYYHSIHFTHVEGIFLFLFILFHASFTLAKVDIINARKKLFIITISMPYFLLELLPMELLHQIFHYLSTIDILHAFSNINFYLDSAISKYEQYHINFRSCHWIHFDLICSSIQPHQIISLILSNNDDTPDQFQLFFSIFNIKQFTRLRSITLIDIEKYILLKLIDILNNNNNCQRLESLKIIPGYSSHTILPKRILTKFCSRQLKRLEVYDASCINIQSLSHLQYLTVHDCNMKKFQQILSSMPMLLSLEVTNYTGDRWITINKVPVQLKRLVLNLGKTVRWETRQFLNEFDWIIEQKVLY